MVRARRIPGIRVRRSLQENARLVIETRTRELLEFREALRNPEETQELHDMRIAAKRLRYALELFTHCFPEVAPLIPDVRGIQTDLGEIHDLDVLIGLLRRRYEALDAVLQPEVVHIVQTAETRGERFNRLRRTLYAQARDPRRIGLLALIGDRTVERTRRYEAFRSAWNDAALDNLAAGLRTATTPVVPEETSPQEVEVIET